MTARLAAAALLVLCVISLHVELQLRTDWLSPLAFSWYGVYDQVEGAAELHRQVYWHYFMWTDIEERIGFSEREIIHFADVAFILRCNTILAIALALGSGIMLRRCSWRRQIMRDAGVLITSISVTLALLAMAWPIFFQLMHPILFPGGNWDFVRGRDVIIELYPQNYLATWGAAILIGVIVSGIALWLGGKHEYEDMPDPPQRWSLALIATPLLFVTPLFAGNTRVSFDWGSWWYYLIALGLLISLMRWSWQSIRTIPYYAGMWLVIYACFTVTVWLECRQALLQARSGNAILGAIAEYRMSHGTFPQSFADLPAESYQHTPFAKKFPFYYVSRGSRIWLGFHGPLKYAYEFSSRRGTWNVARFGPTALQQEIHDGAAPLATQLNPRLKSRMQSK